MSYTLCPHKTNAVNYVKFNAKVFVVYKLSFFLFTLCYIALCLSLFIFFQVWISIDANKRVWRAIEYRSRGIPILLSSLNKSVKIFLVNWYQYIFPIVYQSCFLCIWWHLFIKFFFFIVCLSSFTSVILFILNLMLRREKLKIKIGKKMRKTKKINLHEDRTVYSNL